ncbi:MAG: hypothetical protein C0606_13815 [Hyphomicrobiales bacterium]|nr:MAG: hypothetical protein C0606_13815 [Hyphomicrobiales bacterium]
MVHKLLINDVLRDSAVSKEEKYAYFPIGKAANTNIKRWLWEVECARGYETPVPQTYFDVHNYGWINADRETPWIAFSRKSGADFATALASKFKFTVVRNPFLRTLSGYRDKIESAKHPGPATAAKFKLPSYPESFEEFVAMVCDQDDSQSDIHFRSQTYSCLYNFVKFDKIVHIENLSDELGEVSQSCFGSNHAEANSSEAKHATGSSSVFEKYFTPDLIDALKKRFKSDFELLGYSDDPLVQAPVRPVGNSGRYAEIFPDLLALSAGDPSEPAKNIQQWLARTEVDQGAAFGLTKYLEQMTRIWDNTQARNEPSSEITTKDLLAGAENSQLTGDQLGGDAAFELADTILRNLRLKISTQGSGTVDVEGFGRFSFKRNKNGARRILFSPGDH